MMRNRSAGRNVALFAGGLAAGVVGSRLLPPLFAVAAGRARAGEDPFDRLIEDHRRILSVLDEMITVPTDSRMRRSRLFLMAKRRLAKHAMAEEDVVYPILHRRAEHVERSKHLFDEHADMKILLYELEESLKSGTDWSSAARSLRDLVKRHADEEENRVFPELRRTLSEGSKPKLSGQIRREEAMVL